MFYLTKLVKEISLLPTNIHIDIQKMISEKMKELEGKVMGEHGYIVTIIEFSQNSKGVVENESGNIIFKIDYKAITFKPFIGEILYAVPNEIDEYGLLLSIGPMKMFVSQHAIGENWSYVQDDWVNSVTGDKVEKNKPLLTQIINIRINYNEITTLGTLQ